MMVGVLLLALAFADPGQELKAPPLPDLVPMLEVVVKRDGPRGSGWAGDSDLETLESYITVSDESSGCGLGAHSSLNTVGNFAGTVWHVTGDTQQRKGDVLTVKVTWQRIWENGRSVKGDHPELSQQLTLKAGERFVLEPMAAPSERCGDANLEAGVVMRRPAPAQAGGGAGFSGSGSARARVQGLGSSEMSRLRKEARSVSSAGPLSEVAGPPVDLELWLVDRRDDGSEHAARQLVRAGGESPGTFRFTSVIDDRARGRSTVQITGDIRSVRGGGPNTVRVRVDRRVTSPDSDGGGGTSMVQVVLGDPNDVIAIELPERMRTSAKPLVPGHDFSLRLRLAPDK